MYEKRRCIIIKYALVHLCVSNTLSFTFQYLDLLYVTFFGANFCSTLSKFKK
jgi:hypothetical protein